jgi:creatinine amidohydrolase/Fe(II)-dependent formamide hydrolase-like protein
VNLALHPHLIDMPKAVDEEPRKHPMEGEGITVPLDTVDFSSYGVWGKSTTASAEKGRKVLEAVVDELAKPVVFLRKGRNQESDPKTQTVNRVSLPFKRC